MEGYTCELTTNVTFATPELSDFPISGDHLSGKTDNDITFIIAKDSQMDFIPPSIFSKFRNIIAIDFSGVQLKSLTAQTFKEARNAKKFWLRNNNLVNLPGDIFRNTKAESIQLHSNEIKELSWNTFFNLPNVNRIELDRNHLLWTFDPRVFQNLINLKYLSLWENQLTLIPVDAFKNLQRLEYLSLGINRLYKLETAAFQPLSGLKILHLDRNEITYIEKDLFQSFPLLTELKLNRNACADFDVFSIQNIDLQIVSRIEQCINGRLKCQTTCKIYDEL